MRVAALDLGSNTTLLMIAEMDGARLIRVLHDETTITKLGQGVHANRRFHPEALSRMQQCLSLYAKTIREHQCEKVIAVATSAARDVSNGAELLQMGQSLGIPIHIISGEKEAQLTFKGALYDQPSTNGIAVIDVGGGSTEVIMQTKDGIKGTSVDVGSVRLTELFITAHPVAVHELDKVRDYARNAFAKVSLPAQDIREVIAVAGTPTTLAALDQAIPFEESRIHGYGLSKSKIETWTARLAAMTIEDRERLPGMQPKRADVIVTGSIILDEALGKLGKTELRTSTKGVRYGVALAWQDF
jgi:exopolyphosphatase/guanosine-5'-triphosphate,3'-diphosphate pyrophosphatase